MRMVPNTALKMSDLPGAGLIQIRTFSFSQNMVRSWSAETSHDRICVAGKEGITGIQKITGLNVKLDGPIGWFSQASWIKITPLFRLSHFKK